MPCLSFSINKNHIFFLLIFISYFLREFTIEGIDRFLKEEKKENEKELNYNTKKAIKKLFNIYIYTLSNLLSIVCVCIIKINTRSKVNKSKSITAEQKSSSHLELIYDDYEPINNKKLLIRTLMLTICDFLAQYLVFILYILFDKKKKIKIDIRFDFLCIINILSKYLFSKIILKTRYYKHHYLSFLINILCLIILCVFELRETKYDKYILYYLLVHSLSQILYSLEDVIGKKALIDEFLSPYSLLMFKGIYELIILLIFSVPFLFVKIDGIIIFSKMYIYINSFLKVFFILYLWY